MANLAGLAGFVSELRAERTNLVDRLRRVDAALSVLGKFNGGGQPHQTEVYAVSLGSQADEPRAESAVGKGEESSAETQAHNINSRKTENRGGTKGKVGEDTDGEEEGWLE